MSLTQQITKYKIIESHFCQSVKPSQYCLGECCDFKLLTQPSSLCSFIYWNYSACNSSHFNSRAQSLNLVAPDISLPPSHTGGKRFLILCNFFQIEHIYQDLKGWKQSLMKCKWQDALNSFKFDNEWICSTASALVLCTASISLRLVIRFVPGVRKLINITSEDLTNWLKTVFLCKILIIT